MTRQKIFSTSAFKSQFPQLGVETKSWTVVHWGAIVLSIGLYLGFGLIYNAVCYQCQGLTNPYLVMQVGYDDDDDSDDGGDDDDDHDDHDTLQHGLAEPSQWAVLLITGVVSALPRFYHHPHPIHSKSWSLWSPDCADNL